MAEPTFHEQGKGRRWPVTVDPLTGVQVRIGVMGSAGGDADPRVNELCRRLAQFPQPST